MTKDEALKLALEYVELVPDDRYNAEHIDREALVTAIKEALANEALERKAENARELGLNYEPDWTKEEDEAFNEVERQSNLGKQILRDRANKSSGMDCCTYDCVQGRNCPVRRRTLEEVALEFDKMKPFGDTANSFATFVRMMKDKL